ncbi:MAG: von Willebrand factor type A domain-containing protein [Planctomycetes bacterium]|nr:von Willebrand factor type A domain-containing protein [Planctomycetota bacterium]
MSPDPAALLTAYADGELDAEAAAAVEAALAADAGLRAQLAQIRSLQGTLRGLPAAPAGLRPELRKHLLEQVAWERTSRPRPALEPGRSFLGRNWLGLAVAALLLVVVAGMMLPSLSVVRQSARKSADYAQFSFPTGQQAERLSAPSAGSAESSMDSLAPGVAMRKQESSRERVDRQAGDEKEVVRLAQNGIAVEVDEETGAAPAGGASALEPAYSPVRQERAKAHHLTVTVTSGGMNNKSDDNEPRVAQVGRLAGIPENRNAQGPVEDDRKESLVAAKSKADRPASEALKKGAAKDRERKAPAETDGSGAIGPFAYDGKAKRPAPAKPAAPEQELQKGVKAAESKPRHLDLPLQPALAPAALAAQLANAVPGPLLAGDGTERLANLVEAYRLPLQLAPGSELPLARLQALPPAAGLSAGEQVLLLANRAGLQVAPANGRLALGAVPVALDPTDRLGLEPAQFAAAFGTPPMAVVARDARLTFALDADTASFARARAELERGTLPDPAAIRPEHFVNAVPGGYPPPQGGEAFALYAEAGPSPFARGALARRSALVAVGVVGRAPAAGERRALHLVVAVDASGSMAAPGALERARRAFAGLVPRLGRDDRVAVVAFGERARVVQPAIAGDQHQAILAALAGIVPAGATNTAEGLALACQVGRELAAPGCELRVALVTDGAALAGPDEAAARERVAGLKAAGGSLLILGVGERAADGRALDELARAGDGQQVYLGSDDEAEQAAGGVLLPERLAMLARDAKAQVTWNPERVTHARLVGYERRRLDHAAFRDDRVDAGEIAAATTVTALFEVVLAEGGSGPLGTAAVRYYDTRLEAVRELACPLPGAILAPAASARLRTLACAAELAEQLRGSWWANVRPTRFRAIAAACDGLPPPADRIAAMAVQAERLRPLPEVLP